MIRLVIIDDEQLIRRGLQKIIEMSGGEYEIAGEAADGEEGLKLLLKVSPDIAVVDVKMPKKNGLEMIGEYLAQGAGRTRFIVLSAYDDYVFTRKAIKLGICDYLLKPVNRFDFLRQLEETAKLMRREAVSDGVEGGGEGAGEGAAAADAVKRAVEYIDRYFYQELTLAGVAKEVHMHPNYFGNLFKKKTGVSYLTYLTSVRMEKARELLDNPNLKVYEVGQIVGYYSPKHFSKVFKKHTNMTPNEYRDRNKHV
ncbi:response regulator [Enterocloster asparagiformis]|uniref:response regulator transcription factor n=1 Tax=Enterocloster asparagiformis TaxID=333367 RepID=UPI0034BBD9B5